MDNDAPRSREYMREREATLASWGKVLWDLSISDHVSLAEAGDLDEIRYFLVLLDHEDGTYNSYIPQGIFADSYDMTAPPQCGVRECVRPAQWIHTGEPDAVTFRCAKHSSQFTDRVRIAERVDLWR